MEVRTDLFENAPVPKALAKMAIPTIISQVITMIYNIADTFFIGRTNDPYKVAAATLAFVLFFVLNALSNLFGVGGGSLISRLLGRKEPEEAKKVSALSIYGAILITAVYSLCCLFFMDPLLKLVGASENTLVYAEQYTLWVIVIGGIPSTLSLTLAHLLRSEGRAKQASFGLGLGGVLNIILDPIFMFVIMEPGNEVTGAAIATMISNIVSLLFFCAIFVRMRGKTVLSASPKYIRQGLKYLKETLSVGFPSALGTLFACLSVIMVNNLISGYGDIQLAAMGIVKKIDMLPMNVGMGLCQGMMPLVAYNYSAKNYQRMKAVTNCARLWGIIFALICIACFELFADSLVGLFIQEKQTIGYGVNFLRIFSLATPLMICSFQMTFTFQAMGKGKQSLLLSSCRQGLINIPLLFLMRALFGLYGIVWTQIVSDTLTLIIAFLMYRNVYKKLTAEMKQQEAIE